MKTVKNHIMNLKHDYYDDFYSCRMYFIYNKEWFFFVYKLNLIEIIRARLIHESAKRSYNQSNKS